jgi:hypothetical protein
MNLICVTESELAQWISRKYLDTLATRVFSDLEVLTPNVFYGGPYLKQEDARGRIIVSVKDTWKKLSLFQDNCQSAEVVSIPVSEIIEIAPSMDQHANKLAATYRLPIARWSAEQEWDKWLFNQATLEISRAIFTETSRAGCIPDSTTNQENSINGWGLVLEKRHTWVQSLRVKGHLEHTSMFLASLVQVSSEISYRSTTFNFDLQSADRGWIFEDMSDEIIQELDKFDLENNLKIPPIFCVVAYLRLYDEIQNGNKDWRVIFNLIRFTKYSVSSLHADIMMVSLLSSLKAEEIYSTGIPEIYMM